MSESKRLRSSVEKLIKKSQELREEGDRKEETAKRLKTAISKGRKGREKEQQKPPGEAGSVE